MSYLNVEDIYKKLLEDSHQRKVEKNKTVSSKSRNDIIDNKLVPNMLGVYGTEEDQLEAVLKSGTLNQNNDFLKLNRLALKRGMNHAVKNPKIIPKAPTKEPYHIFRKVKNVYDPDSGKRLPYSDPPKTNLGKDGQTATSFPSQHSITGNENSELYKMYMANPNVENIRYRLMQLTQHEVSHIIFIDWIEKKFGKKMRREIAIRSAEASYNYFKAIQEFELIRNKYGLDKNNPIVIQAVQNLKYSRDIYLDDPLEKVAALIEQDMKNSSDTEVINRNLPIIYKILSDGVKDIKTGRK